MKSWLKNGWVVEHETARQEVRDLLAVADRDLADCRAAGLSADWRMNIAYNAVLQLATVALAADGYRASRQSHHYRVIQSLAHTIHADVGTIAQLDEFRKKRNIAGYERAGSTSDHEAREMAELADQIRRTVFNWLKENHPALL